jgi:hypothetical protein
MSRGGLGEQLAEDADAYLQGAGFAQDAAGDLRMGGCPRRRGCPGGEEVYVTRSKPMPTALLVRRHSGRRTQLRWLDGLSGFVALFLVNAATNLVYLVVLVAVVPASARPEPITGG